MCDGGPVADGAEVELGQLLYVMYCKQGGNQRNEMKQIIKKGVHLPRRLWW